MTKVCAYADRNCTAECMAMFGNKCIRLELEAIAVKREIGRVRLFGDYFGGKGT